MKFIECLQGSPEWLQLRSGKCTASCFADALKMIGGLNEQQTTYVNAVRRDGIDVKDAAVLAGYKAVPKSSIITRALAGEETREPSDEAKRYADDIAIERISGMPHGEPPKAWVLARGHEMEERARMIYEVRAKSFVTESGICVTECGNFAYSSDGLVGTDGLIEIKAPIDSTKIRTMWSTGDAAEYMHQMQGGMWITGRQWVDLIMYVPDLKLVGKDLFVKRVHRDDEFIDQMVAGLAKFQVMVTANERFWRLEAA